MPCVPGAYKKGSESDDDAPCLFCPKNTYQPSKGSTACLACPSHSSTASKTGIADKSGCVCDTGTVDADCSLCPAGQHVSFVPVRCVACPVGQFKASPDITLDCTACPEWSIAPTTGATSCKSCQANAVTNYPATECNCAGGYQQSGSDCVPDAATSFNSAVPVLFVIWVVYMAITAGLVKWHFVHWKKYYHVHSKNVTQYVRAQTRTETKHHVDQYELMDGRKNVFLPRVVFLKDLFWGRLFFEEGARDTDTHTSGHPLVASFLFC